MTRNWLATIFGFLLSGLSTGASGGVVTANGGHVVLCPGKPTEVLDLYEGEVYRGLQADLGRSDLAVQDKVELALTRLARLDQPLADRYRASAATFAEDSRVIDGITIPPIEDSGRTFPIPDGCTNDQIAGQSDPAFPGDFTYLIDGDLWKQLDSDNRAILILHEILYRDAIKNWHHTDSHAVRYFVQLLVSGAIEHYDPTSYSALLRQLNIHGVPRAIDGIGYYYLSELKSSYPNGVPKQIEIVAGSRIVANSQLNLVLTSGMLTFAENGALTAVDLCADQCASVKVTWKADPNCAVDGVGKLVFDEQGHVRSLGITGFEPSGFCYVEPGLNKAVRTYVDGVGSQAFKVGIAIDPNDVIAFFANGVPKALRVTRDDTRASIRGTRNLCLDDTAPSGTMNWGDFNVVPGSEIEFLSNGYVEVLLADMSRPLKCRLSPRQHDFVIEGPVPRRLGFDEEGMVVFYDPIHD